MNPKKLFLLALFPLLLIALSFYSCSSTSDTVSPTGATYPAFNLTVGSVYNFTIDSLPPGGGSIRLNNTATSTILSQGTYFDSTDVFMTQTIERDGGGLTVNNDTTFSKYNAATGKGYNYGFSQLFDPTQSPVWDLITDFSVALNTPWTITTVNIVVIIPQSITLTGPLTAQVVVDTTIQTTGNPAQTIYCYRIEFNAVLQGNTTIGGIPTTLSTTLTWDYYLAYSSTQNPGNPPGLARFRLRPFDITSNPNVGTFQLPGRDRILQTYTIAD